MNQTTTCEASQKERSENETTHTLMIARHQDQYTGGALALHWIMAAAIVAAFVIGWVMTRIPGITPDKLRFFSWHKWIGMTVLALAVVRIIWRATHNAPPLPGSMRVWQRRAAHAVHLLLYALMVAIPITGYLYSSAAAVPVVYLGLVPLPRIIEPDPALKVLFKTLHVALDYSLCALVAGHAAAAVKHQWFDRDGTLARMLPFLKQVEGHIDRC